MAYAEHIHGIARCSAQILDPLLLFSITGLARVKPFRSTMSTPSAPPTEASPSTLASVPNTVHVALHANEAAAAPSGANAIPWPKNLKEPAEFESLLRRERKGAAKVTDDSQNTETTLLFLQKLVSTSELFLGPRVRLHTIAEVDNNWIVPVYSRSLFYAFSELFRRVSNFIASFNEGFRLIRKAR